MSTRGCQVAAGTDIVDALAQWVELHNEAERLHAALPEATKQAIETSGADISSLAAWLATLPVAERLKLRGQTEELAAAMGAAPRVSRQTPQRCHDHRSQLRPGA
jgi:hypothetical protein